MYGHLAALAVLADLHSGCCPSITTAQEKIRGRAEAAHSTPDLGMQPEEQAGEAAVDAEEDNSKFDIGTEYRLRWEHVDNPDLGLGGTRDQVLMQRLLVHADVNWRPGLRTFVQIGSHLAIRTPGEQGPTDEDYLDVTQAFIDLSATRGRSRVTLRLGRQELSLGSSRLISVREGANVRRAFAGARAFWQADVFRMDYIYVHPVTVGRGQFDNNSDKRQRLIGVYASTPIAGAGALSVDVYLLDYSRRDASFAGVTDRERRHSLGARVHGSRTSFDWDIEGVFQFGSFGNHRISAWTLASDTGFRLSRLNGRPRFGMKADVASGDRDPADDKLGTFNPLFPKLPYFTEAGLVAPANLMDVHPNLSLEVTKTFNLQLGANFLWRHRRADAFYTPPLQMVSLPSRRSRYLGRQQEISATWTRTHGAEIKAWYVNFIPSDAIRSVGGRETRFFVLSVNLRL